MVKNSLIIFAWFVCFTSCVTPQKHTYSSSSSTSCCDDSTLRIPDSLVHTPRDIANYINDRNFFDEEKLKIIFNWITENIEYNINQKHDFELEHMISIDRTFLSRKGVCYDYVELFNALASMVNIKSHLIYGYTKQHGLVDSNIHAWCAAQIDSRWYLFDPTWGAGLIRNSKYIKMTNYRFFKIAPEELIKSHMPFDPQWQLLDYPITHEDFGSSIEKKNIERQYFDFTDSLQVYSMRSRIENLISEKTRIEKNKGSRVYNKKLIHEYVSVLDENINTHYFNNTADRYNEALGLYREGIVSFNEYVDYWNNEFFPYQKDKLIKAKLDLIEKKFIISKTIINSTYKGDRKILLLILELREEIISMLSRVERQKEFLNEYMNTEHEKRRLLFYSKI